jgi:hypothetical protein
MTVLEDGGAYSRVTVLEGGGANSRVKSSRVEGLTPE